MKRIITIACLAVGVSLACSAGASAQTSIASKPIDEIRKDSKLHVGSIYVTPTLELRDLGVDTNIFNDAGTPKSDFTFTLKPGSDIAMPIAHRALVEARAAFGLVYFKTYATERSLDPDLAVKAQVFTPHLTFFGENAFLASRQRPNFEIDLRSRRKQNALTGGIELKFSSRTSIQFYMTSATTRWAGDAVFLGTSLQQSLDRNAVTYATKLKSIRTPKTTLTLTTDVTHDRFRFGSTRNSDILRVLPGVEFAPRALISGSAQIGFKRFQTLSTTLPDFKGLITKLDLGYTLLGSTRIAVTSTRDVDYSYERQQPYYVINGLGLNVRRQLFGDNDVVIAGQTTRYSYQLEASSPLITDPRETTNSYSVDIGHRLQNKARLGFGVSHVKRDSRLGPGRNYEGWQYGMSFTYGK